MAHISRTFIEGIEPRRLLSASIVQAGSPATLTDADGSEIRIQLKGPGTLTANVVSNRVVLETSGTNRTSNITFEINGGDGRAEIRSVTAGTLGTFVAPETDIRGQFTAKKVASIVVRNIVKSAFSIDVLGSLKANAIGNSTFSFDHVGSVSIATDLSNSRFFASPRDDSATAIASVSVKGAINRTTIAALGDIGTVTCAAMYSSNITAGVRIEDYSTQTLIFQPLPDERSGDKLYDFTGKYVIGKVIVNGDTRRAIAFSLSNIGAYRINDVILSKVDGNYPDTREFGVAAYKIRSVKRTFDAANASKNSLADPGTWFTVRQISAPLSFDPGGGYTGGTSLGGATFDSGYYGPLYTLDSIPSRGLKIGSVSNSKGTGLFVTPGDNFEIRDAAGATVLSAASLAAVFVSLYRQNRTSIKIENLPFTTFRSTSVSPVVTIASELFGQSALGETNGHAVRAYDFSLQPSPIIPSLKSLEQSIGEAGITTAEFDKALLLVSKTPAKIGRQVNIVTLRDVTLDNQFHFNSGSIGASDLSSLITSASAHSIGSRRLPPRFIISAGAAVIYGLPDGSTISISQLENSALNTLGDLKALPSPAQLQQSLIDSGITFR
jgi:hypothetical protein